MKTLPLIIALCATAGLASATTVVVNPLNMDGWNFYKTDTSVTYGAGDASGQMVFGPDTPPLGVGSANLNTGSDGFQSAQLRNSDWAGTAIADLTSLSYSTYATDWNGSQLPYLTIYLSNGDRAIFEPPYSNNTAYPGRGQAAPALDTWQTWDALSGYWYTDNYFGPGSSAVTWSDILTAEGAGVTIVNDAGNGGIGGIRLASGFASSGNYFNTYVDNFTIGTAASTITYDFEPIPEPSTWIGASLAALLLIVEITRARSFSKRALAAKRHHA
jgi:hypothetical protein